MSEILKDGEVGEFKLEHFEIKHQNCYAMINGITHGTYVKLTQNNQIVMSNTQMEERTNKEFVEAAHGEKKQLEHYCINVYNLFLIIQIYLSKIFR